MKTALIACALACASILVPSVEAIAGIVPGYPDAIVCRSGDMRAIGYLHRVNDDETAVYMTLGQEFAVVTPDGIFHRDGAIDCDGKSLQQLIDDGQASNFGGEE